MAQNRKTVSNAEFNKRVRDLVSRDSNRLRQTFQKFDKECAMRLAEIQNMQEKVRHSMRSLARDKIQAHSEFGNAAASRRASETSERTKAWCHAHHDGTSTPHDQTKERKDHATFDERKKHGYKSSLPGVHLQASSQVVVPSHRQTGRRYSLQHNPTFLRGIPNEGPMPSAHRSSIGHHAADFRTPMASSLPKDAFLKPGSFKETHVLSQTPKESYGLQLQSPGNGKHRPEGYRLSVSALPITASRADPVANLRAKLSPQSDRKRLSTDSSAGGNEREEEEGVDDVDEESDGEGSGQESKSTSRGDLRHRTANMSLGATETEPRRESDPENVLILKTKRPVKRTRSNSLPLAIDPDAIKTVHHRKGGLGHDERGMARHGTHNKPTTSSGMQYSTTKKDGESAANPFEGLRRCRYLRSGDTEA